MTSGGLSETVDAGLLGVEIGRNKVRLAVLDEEARHLGDVVERPIARTGGPRDPIDQEDATREAILAGLERLAVDDPSALRVGTTIGFPNCGVGSGPALADWLVSLSEELGEPLIHTGEVGVSYAPASSVEYVKRVFEGTALHLERVELAPVAAARTLRSVRSGAIRLGSGVAWSARLLDDQVLEAFETADGPVDDELRVLVDGGGKPIERLEGLEMGDTFGAARGLSPGALAAAVGVAMGLREPNGPNLLHGELVGPRVEVAVHTAAGAPLAARFDPALDPYRGSATGEQFAPGVEGTDHDVIGDEPLEAYVDDDLGAIQDELRARRRAVADTYELHRLPRTIERSREFVVSPRPVSAELPERPQRRVADPYDDVEPFAPEVTPERSEGFHISDFLLGALLMLAIVLTVTLVVL